MIAASTLAQILRTLDLFRLVLPASITSHLTLFRTNRHADYLHFGKRI